MSVRACLPLLLAVAMVAFPLASHAARKTVCTITVNSPDERETFRRNLPAGDYEFVELVERGRADWLASACRRDVRCDVLLISGHFDGGDVFYTDRFDQNESLPTDELERVSCSDACPGLFSRLKEVYLFGCNTLNPLPARTASGEVVRALMRAGHAAADAEQLARALGERHAESNRDRMRAIFRDVPVIYGFSSKAPLGRSAGPMLERWFQGGAAAEVASGRPSAKLLGLFGPSSMTVAAGLSDRDPNAAFRADVCHFYDDRIGVARKVEFVHELLRREPAELRMFLDHIERYTASLTDANRDMPPVAQALAAIARDDAARARFLELSRDADDPAVRARMIGVAGRLGWLDAQAQRAESLQMFREMLARDIVGSSDVDLACTLNRDGALGGEPAVLQVAPATARRAGHAALLACLGRDDARAKALAALTGPTDADVQAAQVYLRHRPISDVSELRLVTSAIANMSGADVQVRALDTLAQHRLADRDTLEAVAKLYRIARSADVQRAIAGILLRGDYRAIASDDLVRSLRRYRLQPPDGEDMIDILIRRLQAAI
jgi:hypothetical protein